jgi:lysophospholipase L1-like esterase
MTKVHPEWLALNRGINGERSDQILRRVRRDALAPGPDYVIVLAGVNDVYQGVGVGPIQVNLRTIYREVGEAGVRLVAATILPFNTMSRTQADAIRELNRWIAEETKRSGSLFCDTNSLVTIPGNPGRLTGTPDGLHPDLLGYRTIGEGLARVIEAAESGSESR